MNFEKSGQRRRNLGMLLSKFVSSEFGLLTKRLVWLPLNLLIEYIVKKTKKSV